MKKRTWSKQAEKLGLLLMAIFLIPLFLGSTDKNQEFLRFHVLANSDKIEDQLLKIRVKDVVLAKINALAKEEKDLQTIIKLIENNKPLLIQTASEILDQRYAVDLTITRENYPDKNYGSIFLPQGEYLSVKVVIGEGKGQNWWCVLFPLLCSLEAGEDAIEIVDGGDGPPVRFRFKLAKQDKQNPPSLDTVVAFLQQFRLWP